MKKLLITGGSGFVGANLAAMAKAHWQVTVTSHTSSVYPIDSVQIVEMDITDRQQVFDVIETILPDAVIHTAAISSLDACIEDRDRADHINVTATADIAAAAKSVGAKMVFTSTDLVYAGDRSFYAETDAAVPSCYYGQTKLAAEQVMRDSGVDYAVARVALVYGRKLGPQNSGVEALLENLAAGKSFAQFSTEYRTPVYVEDLCEVLLEMAATPALSGIYNVGGPQRVSRYEFAQILARTFGYPEDLVQPGQVIAANFKDHRPEDCSMNTDKLQAALARTLSDITEGLTKIKETLPMP